jgi:hypothetical protein
MRRFSEIAFAVVATLLTAAVVLQLYLAGVGVFSDPTDGLFAVHGWNGRIVLPLLVLLTILFAALAKAGKRTVWLTVTVLGLLILQTLIFVITGLIFAIGPETPHPPLAATLLLSLHPINGLAILILSGILTRRAWRLARGTGREPQVGSESTGGESKAPMNSAHDARTPVGRTSTP